MIITDGLIHVLPLSERGSVRTTRYAPTIMPEQISTNDLFMEPRAIHVSWCQRHPANLEIRGWIEDSWFPHWLDRRPRFSRRR
jgi:hypothetical protein